jgi:hypothetical protein
MRHALVFFKFLVQHPCAGSLKVKALLNNYCCFDMTIIRFNKFHIRVLEQ